MKLFKRTNRVMAYGMFLLVLAVTGPTVQAQKTVHAKQTTQAQQKNSAVAKIGDYTLTLGEYERQYIRNNGGETAAYKSGLDNRREFLDLLVKYRLKVLEARDKGYDKDPEIQKELSEYRNSLAIPYLTERALIDPNIVDLYNQRLEEVRAAHILIRIPIDSLGVSDSLSAYNKAMDVIRQAREGVSFDTLARRYSDDRGTSENGGDLMWFTAGMTVPSFDQAVYEMKPGEIRAQPVRTMFGYHVVRMIGRKPARGEIQVNHLLVRVPQETPTDTAAAYAKITNILDSLKNGVDFAELAMRNSEDPSSGANGGDLGWVGRRKFVPEFEAVAFELKPGELSGPVRTQFGYHLIKVNGERPPKSLEESRQELKDLYRRYSYEQDNAVFIDGIVGRYNVKINNDVTAALVGSVDTTATTSAPGWYNKVSDALKTKVWVTLKGAQVTVGDAIKTIERNQDLQSKSLNRQSLADLAVLIGRKEALRLETDDLETRYPEFGTLMQEYREGVLLFRAEQDAVWNAVKVDENRLKAFWEEHKSEYTWPDRVRFSEIFVTSDSLANVLRDSLNTNMDFGELAERHTQRTGYKKKMGDWGFQVYEANELSQAASKALPGWIEGPMKFQYGYSIIKVTEKDKAREKTFEEAQSEVSSKFQEFESKRLEREWIESLKSKYGVTIHEEVLKHAFTDLQG